MSSNDTRTKFKQITILFIVYKINLLQILTKIQNIIKTEKNKKLRNKFIINLEMKKEEE